MSNFRKGQQTGFTLVETLIALFVMAIATGSILVLIGQNTRFGADSQERVLAAIVADNVMVEILANPNPLIRGEDDGSVLLGERSWLYTTLINDTSLEGVALITVSVRKEGSTQIRSEISTLKMERP